MLLRVQQYLMNFEWTHQNVIKKSNIVRNFWSYLIFKLNKFFGAFAPITKTVPSTCTRTNIWSEAPASFNHDFVVKKLPQGMHLNGITWPSSLYFSRLGIYHLSNKLSKPLRLNPCNKQRRPRREIPSRSPSSTYVDVYFTSSCVFNYWHRKHLRKCF